jgi:hypothetical protein
MNLLFVTLPAPVPINQPPPPVRRGGGMLAAVPAAAPIRMDAYNDHEGGCFSADSQVLLGDGKTLRCVADIRPGDVVATKGADNKTATVRWVLRMAVAPQGQVLYRLAPGIALTPWHPVQLADGAWEFPARTVDAPIQGVQAVAESSNTVAANRAFVYNLVLDRGHVVLAGEKGELPCVTLVHGLQAANVQHDFFGTERVLDAYRRIGVPSPDDAHLLDIPANARFTRDIVTHLIDGIVLVV